MLQATARKGESAILNMQQPVFVMPIAHGLMHRRSQDFGLGWGGLNRKSHAMTPSKFFEKRDSLWDKQF